MWSIIEPSKRDKGWAITPYKRRLSGVKMSEREIERILQECDNEEKVEKAIEEYLKRWGNLKNFQFGNGCYMDMQGQGI